MSTTIYKNGKIYLGGGGFAEAFAVSDGVFSAVGTDDEVTRAAAGDCACTVVDLHGGFVCAGFNDSHMHLVNYGNALNAVMLSAHTRSLSDMKRAIRDFIDAHKVASGGFVNALGWNHDYFTDVHRMPTRYDLDEVSRVHPIIAYRCCGHCVVMNSRALEVLGFDEHTPCPEGGSIGRDGNGLNGLFFDNAINAVKERTPAPSPEALRTYMRDACRALNAYGITSCQTDDYSTFDSVPYAAVNEAYRALERAGELTVRVYEQCNFRTPEAFRAFLADGNRSGQGSGFFRLGPLKMLGDGSLGARTALLSAPYSDAPGERGLGIYTQAQFDDMILCGAAHGFSAAVHAIGDGCLDMVLDAIEKAQRQFPDAGLRHGIVHCQVTRPDQLDRIARMGLHVYAQTVFLDYDIHIVDDRLGKDRAASSYSWKTLMDKGVTVSNGSDCPVELPDVMKGIQCAVTRRAVCDGMGPYLPGQAFTVSEALDSFTTASARASFDEHRKGRIAPGYMADFVRLGRDPFAVPADELAAIPVEETFVGGVRVFSRAGD